MAELTPTPELPENNIATFTFGVNDNLESELAFSCSGVQKWADERHKKYGDFVEPRIMYVTNYGSPIDEHHVAWVYHRGVRRGYDGAEPYAVHHVTCDCMSYIHEEDRIPALFGCKAVNRILSKRAGEISNEYRIPELIDKMWEDDNAGALKLTDVGKSMIKQTLWDLLTIDLNYPEQWPANLRSGSLLLPTVAKVVAVRPETMLSFVDDMYVNGLVEFDGTNITPSVEVLED